MVVHVHTNFNLYVNIKEIFQKKNFNENIIAKLEIKLIL